LTNLDTSRNRTKAEENFGIFPNEKNKSKQAKGKKPVRLLSLYHYGVIYFISENIAVIAFHFWVENNFFYGFQHIRSNGK
jgi:hypothetical protein